VPVPDLAKRNQQLHAFSIMKEGKAIKAPAGCRDGDEVIRIISARRATRRERKLYAQAIG
jgi:uncharacterized DUF497 family protein